MNLRRIGCGLLALVVALGLATPIQSYAAGKFKDTDGHWAENYINRAVNAGFIKGYPDGKFMPDKAVSRAEFATMVNKALGISVSGTASFKDVPYNEWYYGDVSKAIGACYAGGYEDNTFRPNNPISRQEAAVMISRFVPTYGKSGNLNSYPDSKSIADWAYEAMKKINGKGYIGAYNDGGIHPTDQLSRAQTAKILCDILDKESVVTGSTVVKTSNTQLSGKIYVGDVTIHKDLAENSATIENCVILGNLYIQGGGVNTVTASNSRIASASVDKDNNPVRILAKGETGIVNLTAADSSILQTSSLSGGLYGPGFSKVNVSSSAQLTLRGSFPAVYVNGSKANVTLESGSISNLTVTSSGRYSDITVSGSTTVSNATVDAEAYFHGTGTISSMGVNASGVTYETKPNNLNVSSSVKAPTKVDPKLAVTFSPKDGATNVYIDTKITITFNTAMKKYNGNAIAATDIEKIVELRKKTSNGTKVEYTASIDSAKKVITITPKSNLDTSTKYYVLVLDDTMRDASDNVNDASSASFTTGDNTEKYATTFLPAKNATDVPLNTGISISFSDKVNKYDGSSLSTSTNDSYIKDKVVVFQKNGVGLNASDYDVYIDSARKKITIYPKSSVIEVGTRYYVGIKSNTLKTEGGTVVPADGATWTTAGKPVITSISASANEKSLSVSVTPNVDGTVYAVALTQNESSKITADKIRRGQNSAGTAAAAASSMSVSAKTAKTLTLNGLASDTTYYIYAILEDSRGNQSVVAATSGKTKPLNLKSLTIVPNVSGGSNVLSFSPTTYSYSNVAVPSGTSSVNVTAVANSDAFLGDITINDIRANTASVDLTGQPGSRTGSVTVKITETGKSTVTYTITLRETGSAKLKSMTIDGKSYTPGEYFDISASTSSVVLNITPEDSNAAIILNGGGAITAGTDCTLTLSDLTNLSPTASFTIQSGDGKASENYTIRFKRPTPAPTDNPGTPATPSGIQ